VVSAKAKDDDIRAGAEAEGGVTGAGTEASAPAGAAASAQVT
jgi:hypothetical protein